MQFDGTIICQYMYSCRELQIRIQRKEKMSREKEETEKLCNVNITMLHTTIQV